MMFAFLYRIIVVYVVIVAIIIVIIVVSIVVIIVVIIVFIIVVIIVAVIVVIIDTISYIVFESTDNLCRRDSTVQMMWHHVLRCGHLHKPNIGLTPPSIEKTCCIDTS